MIGSEAHLHPIAVHFVIAPLVLSIVFDFLWLLKKSEFYQKFSWYNLVVASIFGVLSVITGLIAEENAVFTKHALEVFELHELYAFLVITLLLIQLFWRFTTKGLIPQKMRLVYYILVFVNLIILALTANQGGKLVYKYGVTIKTESDLQNEYYDLHDKKSSKFQFEIPDTTLKK